MHGIFSETFFINALFQIKDVSEDEAKQIYIDLVNNYFLYKMTFLEDYHTKWIPKSGHLRNAKNYQTIVNVQCYIWYELYLSILFLSPKVS